MALIQMTANLVFMCIFTTNFQLAIPEKWSYMILNHSPLQHSWVSKQIQILKANCLAWETVTPIQPIEVVAARKLGSRFLLSNCHFCTTEPVTIWNMTMEPPQDKNKRYQAFSAKLHIVHACFHSEGRFGGASGS